tara:strand:+ start:28 stop:804 length:777 start_codon:yes stop_codon:yes gene_type:complete
MTNKLPLICLIFLLLAVPYSLAATIHGTVYDMELNKAENAIVKVNTVPEQTYVAKDGSYSFNIPNGDYNIEAVYESEFRKYTSSEKVKVETDGDYVVDIILFPDISEEESLLEENIEIPDIYPEEEKSLVWLYVIVLMIAAFIVYYIVFKKRKNKKKKLESKELGEKEKAVVVEKEQKPKEEPKVEKQASTEELVEDLADKVLNFIKQNDGRTTQKDIRKQFPLSEAKISLVITELEHKEIIKKIKKGRGNVIILNKE